MNRIHIVGIGFKPLEKEVEELLLRLSVIFCFSGTLKIFEKYAIYSRVKSKLKVCRGVSQLIEELKDVLKYTSAGVLASGDPLYFGIAEKIIKTFGREKVRIYPDLSSLQKACALIGENWTEFFSLSLHGRAFEKEEFFQQLVIHKKLALLTDAKNTPAKIAEELFKSSFKDVEMWVCEKLGTEEERIFHGTPESFKNKKFSVPNIVLLLLRNKEKISFGLKEEEIFHQGGMITKDEIRAVVIHRLRLPETGVLWDIGAGSGSVGLECAKIFPRLFVFSVEKNRSLCQLLQKNKEFLKTFNLKVVEGEAPAILKELPDPHRVFVGGSGGKLREILHYLITLKTLKVLVLTAVSPDTLFKSLNILENAGFYTEVSQISVNRLQKAGSKRIFKALNPVFVVQAERKSDF